MKYHIEFLGIPGSGKTSVYNEVTNRYNNIIGLEDVLWQLMRQKSSDPKKYLLKFIPAIVGKKKAKEIFPYFKDYNESHSQFEASNPELTTLVQTCIAPHASIVLQWMNRLYAQYYFIEHNLQPDQSLVLDEGFAQRAISLFAYEDSYDERKLVEYINLIPLPNIIFVIEIPNDLREHYMHIGNRNFPARMQHMNRKERYKFYNKAQKIIVLVTNKIKMRGGKVVTIHNLDLKQSIVEVKSVIGKELF